MTDCVPYMYNLYIYSKQNRHNIHFHNRYKTVITSNKVLIGIYNLLINKSVSAYPYRTALLSIKHAKFCKQKTDIIL